MLVVTNYQQTWSGVGKKNGKHGEVDFSTVPALDAEEVAKENDQLKRLLGEQALEIAILRDLVKKKNPHLLKNLK
ncbi:transposase [Aneurinibacillus migulanus]|uniref:transposase n=1 Tax=Aneurinibacillus migulanus TaxID=47500 RepID=UPI00116F18E7|nr:transposase [Aneurinibacillus migulanus]GED18241.1 hypothetical protein AMI01nite_62320 [Aneurinibacillus migulanus]